MFYRPGEPHGLPHNPFNALVVPRPIGWISSIDQDGNVNLAPYSFFNAVAYEPPQVMFASNGPHGQGGRKDTVRNIEATEEFVCNFVSAPLAEAMNQTSAPAPSEHDEFVFAGLETRPASIVRPPLVAASPAHLECRLIEIIHLRTPDPIGNPNLLVLGEVVGIHIDEAVIVDGIVDFDKVQPLARLGYLDFLEASGGRRYVMRRPKYPG